MLKKTIRDYVVTLFMLLLTATASAQNSTGDFLVLKSGENFEIKIISMKGDSVEYKYAYFPQGASFKAAKSNIVYLQHADGRKEYFNAQPESPKYVAPAPTPSLIEAIKALNESVKDLKATIEKGNERQGMANQTIVEQLGAVNSSIQETMPGTDKDKRYALRMIGLGINLLTNYSFGIYNTANPTTNPDLITKILMGGAGIDIVVTLLREKKISCRIEPELNFYSGMTSDVTTKSSQTVVSIGVKGMALFHKKRVNIYVGPYIGFGAAIVSTTTIASNISVSTTTALIGAGAVVGGEYLIDPHFSMGLETGFIYQTTLPKVGFGTNSVISTAGKLIGRFYF